MVQVVTLVQLVWFVGGPIGAIGGADGPGVNLSDPGVGGPGGSYVGGGQQGASHGFVGPIKVPMRHTTQELASLPGPGGTGGVPGDGPGDGPGN